MMSMVPTPVNYFANYFTIGEFMQTKDLHQKDLFDASVMITGSHNPPEYNGFKITVDRSPFFGEEIYGLRDEIVNSDDLSIPDDFTAADIDVKSAYVKYMTEEFAHLKGLKKRVVLDCGNGVAGTVVSEIFDALELEYKGLYCDPDGTFPNHHPDPSEEKNLKDLKDAMSSSKADVGFAYDGDADRIAVVTQKYNIKGDQMALLYAMKMDSPTVIGEVKCSQVMYDELNRRGCNTIMYKTGHSNLKVKMKQTGADLACEVSGHIFFKHRYFGFDDAIYATLRMLELLHDGIDIDSEIQKLPESFSTDEIKVQTTDEEKFELIQSIKKILKSPANELPLVKRIITIDGLRIEFENGWGLVRASNTTPVLVTRFEATSKDEMLEYQSSVLKLIEMAKSEVRK